MITHCFQSFGLSLLWSDHLISTSLVTVIFIPSLGDTPPSRLLAIWAHRSKRSSPWLCRIPSMVSAEIPSCGGHNLSSLLIRIVVEYRFGIFPVLGFDPTVYTCSSFSSVACLCSPRGRSFRDASDERYELYLPMTTRQNGRKAGNDPAMMRTLFSVLLG
jgi:hypothetical protein